LIYNEATNGDLSNDRAAPTVINFGPGDNDILGTTGAATGGNVRDYFTFTIPTGATLTALTVLNSAITAGASAFIGLEAGGQITVDPAAATAAPLLGYRHFAPADIGVDILPLMGIAVGAIGFTAPLGAGQYSVWIQDTSPGTSVYGLRFEVPEPGTALLTLTSLASLAWFGRRKTREHLSFTTAS